MNCPVIVTTKTTPLKTAFDATSNQIGGENIVAQFKASRPDPGNPISDIEPLQARMKDTDDEAHLRYDS